MVPSRGIRLVGLALAATLSVNCQVRAQTVDEAIQQSRALVLDFMAESATPGLSVAVHFRGDLVWAEGFGLANVEYEVPVTTGTRFRIGSISKSLTSAAVGLLYERGELDLDAPVQTYVPSFPEKEYPITTRHIGGHLSGIPHYGPRDFQNFVVYRDVVSALDKFKDRPLLFRPGERFQYSSFGWNLMSAVVESASGRPYLELMHDEVFEPLGMQDTMADDYRAIIPNRTGFYERRSGELTNAPFTDNSDVWAGGGFLSTPTDLVIFLHGLLSEELLSAGTLDVLFTPMLMTDGARTEYGLGWGIREDSHGHPEIGHGGGHYGATARLAALPDHELIVAVTANMSGARYGDVFGEILRRFGVLEDGS
ncbi:MAG: beta-lactamase family protein [Gemmatimonadota bacterium]|nr:beta-lactamase family protein [Gemmatimonadota bacterium]